MCRASQVNCSCTTSEPSKTTLLKFTQVSHLVVCLFPACEGSLEIHVFILEPEMHKCSLIWADEVDNVSVRVCMCVCERENQMSKSIWNSEHHQNVIISSVTNYHNFLKMSLKIIIYNFSTYFAHKQIYAGHHMTFLVEVNINKNETQVNVIFKHLTTN